MEEGSGLEAGGGLQIERSGLDEVIDIHHRGDDSRQDDQPLAGLDGGQERVERRHGDHTPGQGPDHTVGHIVSESFH